jgi:hypothetical protein
VRPLREDPNAQDSDRAKERVLDASHQSRTVWALSRLEFIYNVPVWSTHRNLEMKVTLFGATGRTGGLVMERALSTGHEVTVLVRDPSKLKQPQAGLHVIQGDARQAGAVAETVQGTDVVISALGSGGDTLTLFGRNVMAAMERMGVKRIVSLVGASVVVPGDLPSRDPHFAGLTARLWGNNLSIVLRARVDLGPLATHFIRAKVLPSSRSAEFRCRRGCRTQQHGRRVPAVLG